MTLYVLLGYPSRYVIRNNIQLSQSLIQTNIHTDRREGSRITSGTCVKIDLSRKIRGLIVDIVESTDSITQCRT